MAKKAKKSISERINDIKNGIATKLRQIALRERQIAAYEPEMDAKHASAEKTLASKKKTLANLKKRKNQTAVVKAQIKTKELQLKKFVATTKMWVMEHKLLYAQHKLELAQYKQELETLQAKLKELEAVEPEAKEELVAAVESTLPTDAEMAAAVADKAELKIEERSQEAVKQQQGFDFGDSIPLSDEELDELRAMLFHDDDEPQTQQQPQESKQEGYEAVAQDFVEYTLGMMYTDFTAPAELGPKKPADPLEGRNVAEANGKLYLRPYRGQKLTDSELEKIQEWLGILTRNPALINSVVMNTMGAHSQMYIACEDKVKGRIENLKATGKYNTPVARDAKAAAALLKIEAYLWHQQKNATKAA